MSILTAFITHEGGRVHEVAGYISLACAGLRISLGFWGPKEAKFSRFVKSPGATLAYAKDVLQKRESHFLNHNPLGAVMVLALLILSLVGASFGALYVTDRFWGIEWVISLHTWLTWPILGLVAIHLLGVLHASWRHRENLIAAMLHGKKPSDPKL